MLIFGLSPEGAEVTRFASSIVQLPEATEGLAVTRVVCGRDEFEITAEDIAEAKAAHERWRVLYGAAGLSYRP